MPPDNRGRILPGPGLAAHLAGDQAVEDAVGNELAKGGLDPAVYLASLAGPGS